MSVLWETERKAGPTPLRPLVTEHVHIPQEIGGLQSLMSRLLVQPRVNLEDRRSPGLGGVLDRKPIKQILMTFSLLRY